MLEIHEQALLKGITNKKPKQHNIFTPVAVNSGLEESKLAPQFLSSDKEYGIANIGTEPDMKINREKASSPKEHRTKIAKQVKQTQMINTVGQV